MVNDFSSSSEYSTEEIYTLIMMEHGVDKEKVTKHRGKSGWNSYQLLNFEAKKAESKFIPFVYICLHLIIYIIVGGNVSVQEITKALSTDYNQAKSESDDPDFSLRWILESLRQESASKPVTTRSVRSSVQSVANAFLRSVSIQVKRLSLPTELTSRFIGGRYPNESCHTGGCFCLECFTFHGL